MDNRIHAILTPKAVKALEESVEAEEVNKTMVINRAIQVYNFLRKHRDAGGTIIIVKDGKTESLLII